MELHIKDRIYIPQLLPAQNSFMEYNLKREIIKNVALPEKDKGEHAIVEDQPYSCYKGQWLYLQ